MGVDWFFFPVALIINEFLNAHQNAFLSRPTAADLNQLNVRASVLPLKQLSADDDTGSLVCVGMFVNFTAMLFAVTS